MHMHLLPLGGCVRDGKNFNATLGPLGGGWVREPESSSSPGLAQCRTMPRLCSMRRTDPTSTCEEEERGPACRSYIQPQSHAEACFSLYSISSGCIQDSRRRTQEHSLAFRGAREDYLDGADSLAVRARENGGRAYTWDVLLLLEAVVLPPLHFESSCVCFSCVARFPSVGVPSLQELLALPHLLPARVSTWIRTYTSARGCESLVILSGIISLVMRTSFVTRDVFIMTTAATTLMRHPHRTDRETHIHIAVLIVANPFTPDADCSLPCFCS